MKTKSQFVWNKFKQLRQWCGLTFLELAEKSKLSKGLLSKLENSRNPNPTLKTIMALAKALDVMPNDIFCCFIYNLKINPEWLALENKPHFVIAASLPDAYKSINVGPAPKSVFAGQLWTAYKRGEESILPSRWVLCDKNGKIDRVFKSRKQLLENAKMLEVKLKWIK